MSRINRFHCLRPFLLTRFACLWLVALAATAGIQAATLRVEKTGDANTYRTINSAIAQAEEKDTILVGPGLYEEQVNLDKSLKLQGAGPQFVTIKPSDSGHGIYSGDGGTVWKSITISGMTIISPNTFAINIAKSQVVYIKNCIITGSYAGIHHNSCDQEWVGAQVYVSNCTFAYLKNWAQYFCSRNSKNGGFETVNCIFYNNGVEGDATVLQNASASFYRLDHCNVFGRQPSGQGIAAPVTGDPKFLDPKRGNFMLADDSPAKNAGMPGPGFLDPDGSANDLGAYGGPGAASFWPYKVNGPIIRDITVTPATVAQGGKITIKATATTR